VQRRLVDHRAGQDRFAARLLYHLQVFEHLRPARIQMSPNLIS